MEEFQKKVDHALIDLGLKRTDLARMIGITDSYLSDILAGKREAPEQKAKICDLLIIGDSHD